MREGQAMGLPFFIRVGRAEGRAYVLVDRFFMLRMKCQDRKGPDLQKDLSGSSRREGVPDGACGVGCGDPAARTTGERRRRFTRPPEGGRKNRRNICRSHPKGIGHRDSGGNAGEIARSLGFAGGEPSLLAMTAFFQLRV